MEKELNLLDFVIIILKHKWLVLINFILISIIALVYALTMSKWYKSEVVFIPKGRAGTGLFSIIGDNLSADIIGGTALSKRQYKALLYSRELREKLIKKFNLIGVYEKTEAINPTDQTLRILEKIITIEEEEEGGLGITDVISIKITTIDKDPVRASEMANYLFSLLEKKALSLNRKEYDKIISFLFDKINECNLNLDSCRREIKQFQLANHVYDIPQQVSMVLQAFATGKAEILLLDNQIKYLQSIHSKDFNGIAILKNKKASLEKNLMEMENINKDDVFLGLAQTIGLSSKYIDLATEVETYTQLRVLLKQQFEQAKIKQSKNFSPLYVIDSARPAEYKFKPKRAVVILAIVFVYMSLFITSLLLWNHYNTLRKNRPDKLEKIDLLLQQIFPKKK